MPEFEKARERATGDLRSNGYLGLSHFSLSDIVYHCKVLSSRMRLPDKFKQDHPGCYVGK